MCHHFNILLDVFHPHLVIVGEENIYLIEHRKKKSRTQFNFTINMDRIDADKMAQLLSEPSFKCNLNLYRITKASKR